MKSQMAEIQLGEDTDWSKVDFKTKLSLLSEQHCKNPNVDVRCSLDSIAVLFENTLLTLEEPSLPIFVRSLGFKSLRSATTKEQIQNIVDDVINYVIKNLNEVNELYEKSKIISDSDLKNDLDKALVEVRKTPLHLDNLVELGKKLEESIKSGRSLINKCDDKLEQLKTKSYLYSGEWHKFFSNNHKLANLYKHKAKNMQKEMQSDLPKDVSQRQNGKH